MYHKFQYHDEDSGWFDYSETTVIDFYANQFSQEKSMSTMYIYNRLYQLTHNWMIPTKTLSKDFKKGTFQEINN